MAISWVKSRVGTRVERNIRQDWLAAARMDLTQLTQALSNTLHPELRAQAEAQLEQVRGTHAHPHALTTAPGLTHNRYTGRRSSPITCYKWC